ncbi:hypothetical protein [Streptomyces gossypiisoli]|uniref:hypothetical protein n=1 Tax=Streptomyces gossypiisoli TaxID=2748864 RepID=UPI0015DB2460|nr:hypothetical protein [Streptomyces gossypiisoli]
MDDSRPPAPGTTRALRDLLPPPALGGFLLLLAVVFGVSYAVGSAVGPDAPGVQRTDSGTSDAETPTGTGTHGDHPEGHAP